MIQLPRYRQTAVLIALILAVSPLGSWSEEPAEEKLPVAEAEARLTAELGKLNQIRISSQEERREVENRAIDLLWTFLRTYPESQHQEHAATELVTVLRGQRRFGDAIEAWSGYMKHVKEENKLYRATRSLANLHDSAAQEQKAIEVLRSYLKEHEGNKFETEVRIVLARALSAAGDDEAAAALMAEQLKKHPELPTAPEHRLERIQFLNWSGDGKTSLKELEAFMKDEKLANWQDSAVLQKGYAHESLGETDAALKEFRKLQTSQDAGISSQGFISEAELFQRLGDRDKAVTAMEAAFEKLHPRDQLLFRPKLEFMRTMGQAAPDFEIETLDGEKVKLTDFKGKYLLLDFWATWCHPCYKEIPVLSRMRELYSKERLAMIGVSLDRKGMEEEVKKFTRERNMNWPQALAVGDFDAEICTAFKVTGIPHPVLIDPEGKIVSAGVTGKALARTLEREMAKAAR